MCSRCGHDDVHSSAECRERVSTLALCVSCDEPVEDRGDLFRCAACGRWTCSVACHLVHEHVRGDGFVCLPGAFTGAADPLL